MPIWHTIRHTIRIMTKILKAINSLSYKGLEHVLLRGIMIVNC